MMDYEVRMVSEDDSNALTRYCEWPAMRDDALTKIMFPDLDDTNEEECILWSIGGLLKSIKDESTSLMKVCGKDGTPLGFAGWRVENASLRCCKFKTEQKSEQDSGNSPPLALDVTAWSQASQLLRAERRMVLAGRKNIWRLFTLSVKPDFQRRGVGSALLKWGCDFADQHGYDSFVMASVAGLTLYRRFGFEVVGEVHLETGSFTSMIRRAERSWA